MKSIDLAVNDSPVKLSDRKENETCATNMLHRRRLTMVPDWESQRMSHHGNKEYNENRGGDAL